MGFLKAIRVGDLDTAANELRNELGLANAHEIVQVLWRAVNRQVKPGAVYRSYRGAGDIRVVLARSPNESDCHTVAFYHSDTAHWEIQKEVPDWYVVKEWIRQP
jgi:hypothetical protein